MKQYSPATINYDDNVAVGMSRLVIELRKSGYKGITKTFIINALSDYLLQEFEKGGVKKTEKFLKEPYTSYMEYKRSK